MPNYSNEEQQVLTKEMSDKIYNDSYSTTEEELQKDTNWIEATKGVYKQLEGTEWSGSDEDAAKKGLEMMSRFNYNLTLGTINYTAQLQGADDKTKLEFYYMMDMYDKKDISGNGTLRAFKEMGLDPASYIGIGTLGMGFAGKQAATTAAKTGLKSMLKQGAIKYLQSPTAIAATEGAIYTGTDDFARQDAAIGAGVQDEYSPGQTAVATTIGAAAGAGIVKGTQAVGSKISKVVNAQEDALRKNFEEGGSMAGGGKPPIVQVDPIEIKPNNKEDITLYRGVSDDNTGTGEALIGKGLYLTPSETTAKRYGSKVEEFIIQNDKLFDATKEMSEAEYKEFVSLFKGTKNIEYMPDENIGYTYESLKNDIGANTGIDYEEVAEKMNSLIKKKNYEGIFFDLSRVNDSVKEGEKAFLIFPKGDE